MSASRSSRHQPAHIPPAPANFHGTLGDLFDKHIQPILPSRDAVLQFHEWMCRYADAEPESEERRVFPVRAVSGTMQGEICPTSDGTGIAPSENSHAWVAHALLVGADGDHPLRVRAWLIFIA